MPYLSRQGDAGLHHARQKCYYDFRHQLVIYSVGDLIVNLMDSVTSIVHGPPLGVTEAWGGQVQVSQVWRRQNVGVFHIMNIQSFYSWIFFFWVVGSSKQGPRGDGCRGLEPCPRPQRMATQTHVSSIAWWGGVRFNWVQLKTIIIAISGRCDSRCYSIAPLGTPPLPGLCYTLWVCNGQFDGQQSRVPGCKEIRCRWVSHKTDSD